MQNVRNVRKRWLSCLGILIFILLSACSSADRNSGSSNSASSEMKASQNQASDAGSPAADSTNSVSDAAPQVKESAAVMNQSGTSFGADAVDSDAEGFDRKIVYHANLTLEVGNFDKAAAALQNAIHQSGGYMLQFNDSKSGNETGATYTIKVPADGFMPFLDRLEKIEHTLFERQLQGTDVTEEYVDLEARLKAKQVVETRLLGFMDKAQKADDLVRFSDQLGSVQQEIEQIKGRMRYLDKNVAYSTIELRMYQPGPGESAAAKIEKPLGSKMAEAITSSTKGTIEVIQALLIFAAGALPVLLLLFLIAVLFLWLRRRGMRNKLVSAGPVTTDRLQQTSTAADLPDEDK